MRSTARVESGRVCSTLSCSCESALITPTSSRARSPVIIYLFMYLFIIFNRCISALTTLPLRVPGARYRMWAYEGLYVFVRVYVSTYLSVSVCQFRVWICVCARTYTFACTLTWCVHDYGMQYVCLCPCVCVCVCVDIYQHIYLYIHKYIHAYICRAAVRRGRASSGEQREAESARQAYHQGAVCACVWRLGQLKLYVCMYVHLCIVFLYVAFVRRWGCNVTENKCVCMLIYISSGIVAMLLNILDSFFLLHRPRPRDTVCSFSRRWRVC